MSDPPRPLPLPQLPPPDDDVVVRIDYVVSFVARLLSNTRSIYERRRDLGHADIYLLVLLSLFITLDNSLTRGGGTRASRSDVVRALRAFVDEHDVMAQHVVPSRGMHVYALNVVACVRELIGYVCAGVDDDTREPADSVAAPHNSE